MVKRLCMTRLGEDEYDMHETPNGGFVRHEDYKKLEEETKNHLNARFLSTEAHAITIGKLTLLRRVAKQLLHAYDEECGDMTGPIGTSFESLRNMLILTKIHE